MQEDLILRTSLSAQLMRRALWRGFLLALVGSMGIVYWGAFASVQMLRTWGFLLFIGCLALITAGLLPYRRLSRLQMKPNELRVGLDRLTFYLNNRKALILPLKVLDRFDYLEDSQGYGIAFWLKDQTLSNHSINSKSLSALSKRHPKAKDAHLFFPYLTRRSYEELKRWLSNREEED